MIEMRTPPYQNFSIIVSKSQQNQKLPVEPVAFKYLIEFSKALKTNFQHIGFLFQTLHILVS